MTTKTTSFHFPIFYGDDDDDDDDNDIYYKQHNNDNGIFDTSPFGEFLRKSVPHLEYLNYTIVKFHITIHLTKY